MRSKDYLIKMEFLVCRTRDWYENINRYKLQ